MIMKLARTTSENNDFQNLVRLLDADLAVRDGDEHDFYHQFNGIANIKNCVVLFEDDQAVGCGAFKPHESGSVEIKRMFTRPDFRGKGVAVMVLNELESWAKELGYTTSVLETGNKQPEAIALYQKQGYRRIPNYGQYAGVENSLCFQKELE